MIRMLLIFVISALLAALLALVVRSALHRPYDHLPAPTPEGEAPAVPPAADPHAGHAAAPQPSPVNTICAICGMDVDPDLPTTTFHQQVIGFACLKCPPKFAADPERYGPAYLRNEKLRQALTPGAAHGDETP